MGTPYGPPECPFFLKGAPGGASETAGLSSSLCSYYHRAQPPNKPRAPSQSDLPLRSLRGSGSPVSFSPNRVPRPRAAAESLTRHLLPAPLAPDRRRDRRVAPRASGWGRRPGRGAGGGDGVPRGGPYSARSSGRCGSDSRSRSHFSPSRVMSRGSSQS